jgi:DNA-binding NtrC family response regulator
MSDLKTCLLISDDPDDHQTLSEGIKDATKNIILLSSMDVSQILKMLTSQKLIPDYIIVDFAMEELDGQGFLKTISENSDLTSISIIVYADRPLPTEQMKLHKRLFFLSKQLKYSELQKALKTMLT